MGGPRSRGGGGVVKVVESTVSVHEVEAANSKKKGGKCMGLGTRMEWERGGGCELGEWGGGGGCPHCCI